jgi:CubicO group peptidase (beta-lactamase class C family)
MVAAQAHPNHRLYMGNWRKTLLKFLSSALALAAASMLAISTQASSALGQDLSLQVDQIFAAYNRPDSPGCSLGVIRNGTFLYRKSYGEASLELGVPLSSESVFYVGSISKQFTAASVVLAAEQGSLSLDDDVRKYIPELPDYGRKITLRQMLNQTSGFRDFLLLIYFSGHDAANFNSPAEILKMVVSQRGLNNMPGDEWVYSNTNYFLLGIVVERATKKTLAEFAEDNIFQPLGMTKTRFYDDASAVVPGRVPAYYPGKGGNFLVGWSTTYAIVGGGGLMTTVDDLLKWDDNFYSNHLGKGTLLRELQTPGVLNSGKHTMYGMGLSLENYRGLPVVEHDGSLFGYRADMLRFPTQKFSVICLCNISKANPDLRSRHVADLYLKDFLQSNATAASPTAKTLPDPSIFVGQYFDPHAFALFAFTAADGNLQQWGSAMQRKSANQFYNDMGDLITFHAQGDSMKATWERNGQVIYEGERLGEFHLSAELKEFVGDYRSGEVDGEFQIASEQGQLVLKNGNNPPIKLTAIAKDEFNVEGSLVIVFRRNAGKVSGLTASAPQARGIEFNRTN